METSKEMLFAQYWNQRVALYYEHTFDYDFEYSKNWLNVTKLKLKSLSNLSKEDAIFIYCSRNGILATDRVSLVDYSFSNNILCIEIYTPDYGSHLISKDYFLIDELSVKLTDYLRSRGYAVPFMGLSVGELIENGWLVLE